MCRKCPRRCTRQAQKKTTDIARPTGPTGTGARSACKPRNETRHTSIIAAIKANEHVPVIAMGHMYMNETTDDINNPMLVIHDRCSEGVWAVFTEKKGDSAHVKSRVANIIRVLEYSKVVIKSHQQPAIRSMGSNVVESLCQLVF